MSLTQPVSRTFSRIAVVLMFSIFSIAAVQAESRASINKEAPDFTLTDVSGEPHTLSDFKGKLVVLEWFNPDCPFVKKHYETQNMQGLQKKYTHKGVIWLSINSSAEGKQGFYSDAELARKMEAKNTASTAVLRDPDGRIGRLYGAKTTPHIFILDKEGVIRYMGAIDDKPSMEKDDVEGARNYVAAALDALLAGDQPEKQSVRAYGCSVKY